MADNSEVASSVTPSADGVPIAYSVAGEGPLALVFVHGWCGQQSHWSRQVDPLSAQYRVVTIDLAGHGGSGGDRRDWTIAAFAEDVVAVVRRLGLNRVVLIGHSQGGSVVVEAASRLPAETVGVIGVDTWSSLQGAPMPGARDAALQPFHDNFREHTEQWIRRMFAPDADPELVTRIAVEMADHDPDTAIAAMAGNFDYTPGFAARIGALPVPKYAIASEFSLYPKDPEVARRYGIGFTKMEGVGHFLMLEDPDRFNAELGTALEWIAGKS